MTEGIRSEGGSRSRDDVEHAVVVYTQPHCAPCRQVEAYLRQRAVPFVVRDVVADPDALAVLEARGYMGTPVTRVGDTWIAGFRRDALDQALAVLLREHSDR